MSAVSPDVLNGKTALVTGASRGIGRAIAVRLARRGALTIVHYSAHPDEAEATVTQIKAEGGSAIAMGADIGSTSAIEALFRDIDSAVPDGRIDIVVNNAATVMRGHLGEVREADFDRQFAVNIKGMVFVTQAAVARMPDGGRVINISSMASKQPNPHAVVYAATKGAVDSFTISLAADLGARGITVNVVAPGMTATPMTAPTLAQEELAQRYRAATWLGRIGQPDDVAAMVEFLATPDAGWVTGQIIAAAGGLSI